MDPLSVAASIVGLILAAGQVSSGISIIQSILSEAPRINHLLNQVKEIETCLSAIQKFIYSIQSASKQRMAFIKIEHLVAALTQAVLTFSELEALVKKFVTGPRSALMLRVNWTRKQNKIANIIVRLDSHKSTLSLILSIVRCESDHEANKLSETLHKLANQILAANKDVSKRLRNLEDMYESESIYTSCYRNGRSDSGSLFSANSIMNSSTLYEDIRPVRKTPDLATYESFQTDLSTSRVYRRTLSYECDISFTTSVVRTHAWSIFTGLSLSEISDISVIALPLSARDISNPQWYFKYPEKRSSNPVERVPPSPLRSATERRKARQRSQRWPQAT
ncbi:hypothetical protein N431DRAFT_401900 [Stipitochalara longipes BDJ]|nr:hypothetical protein N431DRAFT_401900 [Stipitochalara longipes BDJ]